MTPTTTISVENVSLATGTLALVTMAGTDGRPATLGPESIAALEEALAACAARVHDGEVTAVALTGTPGCFAAGADLRAVGSMARVEDARAVAEAGHRIVTLLRDLPSFALLSGLALGGGLELALACRYRVAAADTAPLGLPETSLGLVPGWGGCYLLPRLVGPEAALQVIVDNPARQRTLDAQQGLDLGLVDSVQRGGDDFRDGALAWVTEVLSGAINPARTDHTSDAGAWEQAVSARRPVVARRAEGGAPAPLRALELVAAARTASRAEGFAAEDLALTELIMSDQLRAGLYAFDLTRARARRPAGAPSEELARPVRRVGLLGAGLMASQLAVLLARTLRVPVVMRDLDDDRAAAGLRHVHDQVARLERSGRLDETRAEELRARVTATADLTELAGCDLVVEAVFEELAVKQRVFAEVEPVVGPECVLATNTSALSVTDMAAGLEHPERVVGLHFFNPVAQMPLVEVVRTPHTSEAAYATAFAVAAGARKSAVACRDAPGFVVNRVLVRLLGEVLGTLEEGTPVSVADRALRPMGLPMGPLQLLQLVGPAVAMHVLDELRRTLGDRYPHSPGLERMVAEGERFTVDERPSAASAVREDLDRFFGSRPLPEPLDADGVLERVRRALAQEVRLLLDDGVVADVRDVDLAMVLGAGWPLHNGGIAPYLDRTGTSEAVTGRRFLEPGVATLPTP
ncbi:3-hydroxyacyl-CoA dehydrogenase [Georgenia satyanarayanai]|uniref:3-hydroxyacyl-CoA dehydrogenase n=1 Tax=Georgenia satyanarayanai TaxID=860221 RepID=A0A2Y8ZXQ7_9MICO|nr:3-hydroxyacyl-CoA dehydrogenase NAD-binding domain-containing protein [Georgenia satyanarayanai]PYG02053.1 3-hydroxyacyl-CoA dehydrogenase [Georgenia satyanarayanai]SSA36864.1 3-hydroxyacyl-CoA dehydrogenase [Georgenia satyanarayanai]